MEMKREVAQTRQEDNLSHQKALYLAEKKKKIISENFFVDFPEMNKDIIDESSMFQLKLFPIITSSL